MTPIGQTLELLRAMGYTATAITGLPFADLLACRNGEILAVRLADAGGLDAGVKTTLTRPGVDAWMAGGGRVEVWSFAWGKSPHRQTIDALPAVPWHQAIKRWIMRNDDEPD